MIFELSCVTKLPNCSPIITCQFKGPISESNIAFKALHISDSDLNSCTATKMNIGIETPWKTATFKKNWVSTQTNQDRTETNKNNNFKTETYSFAVLVDDVFYQNNCLVCVGFVHFTETNVCVFNVFLRCHCEGFLWGSAVVVGF